MRRATIVRLGVTIAWLATAHAAASAEDFVWQGEGSETTLLFDGRPALRYMHKPFDDTSPETIEATFKPYHHVFSPDGATLLTKGLGGLYPHHRGLFYGFREVTYGDGQQCDVWHCTDGAYQVHARELHREADDDSAAHVVAIEWHGKGGELFAVEERMMGIRRRTLDGVEGWQVDFASHLKSVDGKPIHLNGDPQHAGFHFRAAQEVADVTAKQTYYLRTDGKGALDETRNWDPAAAGSAMNAECENRPWNAMSFVIGGNRYTALYLDHPSNPKPSRYSERDYGRFGSDFVADATSELPLNVKYRLWVQTGEMTVDQCEHQSTEFIVENTVLPTVEVGVSRREPPPRAFVPPEAPIDPAPGDAHD